MATTPYTVKLAPAAHRQLRAFPLKQQKLIIRMVDTLSVNPRPAGAKKVEGMTGLYSEAVNHNRLLYKIEDHEILVLVIR